MARQRKRKHPEPPSFRDLQIIADLCSAVRHLGAFPPVLISDAGDNAVGIFRVLIGPQDCRIPDDLPEDLINALILTAASPEDDMPGFIIATGILLADALQSGKSREDFSWHWEIFADHYRAAAPPVRSALMNGFFRARQKSLVSDEVQPSLADRITREREELLQPLRKIARSMTTEERLSVAHGDSYANTGEVQRHLAALNAMLDEPECRFPDDVWYPLEAVELVTNNPSYPGFVPCIALLLLDALHSDTFNAEDGMDAVKFRWARSYDTFCSLPLSLRDPILNAVRYVFETDDDGTGWGWADPRLKRKLTPIPWLAF